MMLYISRWKAISMILTCLIGLILALPNMLPVTILQHCPTWMQKSTVNLGLELRGGSYLQLDVDLPAVEKDYLSTLLNDVRNNLRKNNIRYLDLKVDKDRPVLSFKLYDPESTPLIKKIIQDIDPTLIVTIQNQDVEVKQDPFALQKRQHKMVEQCVEVIRRRIDETGTKEPSILPHGIGRISVQLPGVDNPQEIKRRIGKTAKMTFHLLDETQPHVLWKKGQPVPRSTTYGVDYLPEKMRDGSIVYLPIKKQVSLSGDLLSDAHVTMNEGSPVVGITFNQTGAKKFFEITSGNLNRFFAVVLDREVITAPKMNVVIPNGQAIITGNFSIPEAHELALLLRAGSLPAPLKVIEERTIGPSLGADSIDSGRNSTLIAFVLVALFMGFSYRLFGIFSSIALIVNMVLLFAGLSLLQATLTLPGIAGIALTIGMAVDANVLIYERIKEELRMGAKPILAIEAGFKRAIVTIMDSNITTLITAAMMFVFGTGPVRGFAVTLSIGILTSLFTAISLTRFIISRWIGRKRLETLPL